MNDSELLPARMVNEFVYCPRLFWLEYVEREFEASYDTVDGERIHRRVDTPRGALPDEIEDLREATSVELTSRTLGVVAKIDLVRERDGYAVPIDFKRGSMPRNGPYDPERVQVALQGLLLREAGYPCRGGRIYYAESKQYAAVPIDAELEALVTQALAGARAIAARTYIPPPLVDSPKCPRCSLHSVCLPDETNLLAGRAQGEPIRPFSAPADERIPIYVVQPGSRVGISGETLQVRVEDEVVSDVPLVEVGGISLFGNAHISSQAMRAILARNVTVSYLSYGGWLNGYARSVNDHSLDLRIAQYEAARDAERCLKVAQALVAGKIKNQRTMVRRLLGANAATSLRAMAWLQHRAMRAKSPEELLGIEGNAAREYFECFGSMLSVGTGFEVTGRNRRPPTDPVNALLSFGYSMLTKECLAAAIAVGFEPGLGFYHRLRAGRPSLALDLMEEFRPLIVDSTVLSVINTGELKSRDFERHGRAIVLTSEGRKKFIMAIERRLRSTITHPLFGYEVTYRRALHVQARLLARAIQGDIPAYRPLTTR